MGYPEIFHIPAVTSVFFSTFEGFLGDSLYSGQANQGSLPVSLGRRNCSARSAGESDRIFQRAGSLMVFLELQPEAGLCSQVTAREDIKNFCLFSDVRPPI